MIKYKKIADVSLVTDTILIIVEQPISKVPVRYQYRSLVLFDAHLSMANHVMSICKCCFFQLLQLPSHSLLLDHRRGQDTYSCFCLQLVRLWLESLIASFGSSKEFKTLRHG